MRRLLILFSVLVLVGACGTVRLTPEQKREQAARTAQLVNQRLDARTYRISVDYMYPLRGRSKALTDSYSLTVDGDKVISHLPYFGVAYSVPYGGGKALVFEDEIKAYAEDTSRSDRRRIQFSTDNGEDFIVYTVTVFDNCEAEIHVNCRNRDDISYRGTLYPEEFPKE